MKRIFLLALGLCSLWSSGCCWWYSRHACYDDCYYAPDDSCVEEYREPRRKGRHKRRRDRRNRYDVADGGDCCGADCCGGTCGSCCGSSCGSGCDGGCGTCGAGGCSMNMDGSGMSMGGGCANGNCNNTQITNSSGQMYGGMPFDANSGWTIQSTTSRPVGNEPVMAPPSGATPINPAPSRAQGWAPASAPSVTPSSAPVPTPVPPVSYNR